MATKLKQTEMIVEKPIIFQLSRYNETQQVSTPSQLQRNYSNIIYKIGIAEISIGVISIILAICGTVVAATSTYTSETLHCMSTEIFTFISHGTWIGLVMIVTGIIGIMLAKKPSKVLYIANMAMAIITVVMTFIGLVLSGIPAVFSTYCSGAYTALLGIHIVLAVIFVVMMTLSIIHANICRKKQLGENALVSSDKALSYNLEQTGDQSVFTIPMQHLQGVSKSDITIHIDGQDSQTMSQREASLGNLDIMFGLGITEIIIGVILIVLGVVVAAIASIMSGRDFPMNANAVTLSQTCQGVWCGVFIIVTGILGILHARSANSSKYTANLAMSILTILVVCVGLILSGIAVFMSIACCFAIPSIHIAIAVLCFLVVFINIAHVVIANRLNRSPAQRKQSPPAPESIQYLPRRDVKDVHHQESPKVSRFHIYIESTAKDSIQSDIEVKGETPESNDS